MAHPAGHNRHHSNVIHSDPLVTSSIAPALTKSEHLNRIVQWTKSVQPQNASIEDEDTLAQSLLIDEGVRRLRHWDREMRAYGNDDVEFDEHNEPISAAMKLNLIADLNNIKKVVDPDDKITPRIIVQEFEKFMDSKLSALPQRNKKSSGRDSIIDKRVQFRPFEERGEVRGLRQHNLNVAFTVTYPDKDSNGKRGTVDKPTKQREPLPNNDPEFWKRKIRQGFIETEEMMSKLVTQRKEEEKIINGVPGVERPAGSTYHPKLYTSIAARATRMERQRLDRSMERLRKRHEDCFGSCTVQEYSENDASDANTKGKTYDSKPPTTPQPQKEPIPVPQTLTPRFDNRPIVPGPPKVHEYTDKMNKLMAFGIPNPRSPKVIINSNVTFKVPTTSKYSPKKGAEVQVIYERNADSQHPKPHTVSSDRKMGSERWPEEYLKSQRPQRISTSRPLTAPKRQAEPLPLSHNSHKSDNNSIWVKQFIENHKNKIKKDQTEHQAIKDKRKAESNALYKDLLFNKTRLQNEVEIERRRMQMSWKFNGGGPLTGQNQKDHHHHHNKDKLPDRFRPYTDEIEENKGPKEPLKYTWKERPKGLNIWLEGVMAKAKEDKEAKQKHKDTIIPLSSYQF